MTLSEENLFAPLTRHEIIKAVEKKHPYRIPIIRGKWWGEGFEELHGNNLRRFDKYPEDVVQVWIDPTPFTEMGLSWEIPSQGAHDAQPVLEDWKKLDELIEKFPAPEKDPRLEEAIKQAEAGGRKEQYVLLSWWFLYFERSWKIRGMQNILIDLYENQDSVEKLLEALTDQYIRYIRFIRDKVPLDGFFSSDDLGHQKGPMFSPELFHRCFYPRYKRLGSALKGLGMHFWLHSCGDNSLLLDHLVDAGLDVFHPVQKYTMDERETARKYGNKLAFLAGLDVQHVLQKEDPEAVRREVRFLIDTFDRPDGGMCLGAGNGILPGTPLENITAFLEEAIIYGYEHRQRSG